MNDNFFSIDISRFKQQKKNCKYGHKVNFFNAKTLKWPT